MEPPSPYAILLPSGDILGSKIPDVASTSVRKPSGSASTRLGAEEQRGLAPGHGHRPQVPPDAERRGSGPLEDDVPAVRTEGRSEVPPPVHVVRRLLEIGENRRSPA